MSMPLPAESHITVCSIRNGIYKRFCYLGAHVFNLFLLSKYPGDVARVTGTPRGYIIWASPMRTYIDNTITSLRYTTFRVTHSVNRRMSRKGID